MGDEILVCAIQEQKDRENNGVLLLKWLVAIYFIFSIIYKAYTLGYCVGGYLPSMPKKWYNDTGLEIARLNN